MFSPKSKTLLSSNNRPSRLPSRMPPKTVQNQWLPNLYPYPKLTLYNLPATHLPGIPVFPMPVLLRNNLTGHPMKLRNSLLWSNLLQNSLLPNNPLLNSLPPNNPLLNSLLPSSPLLNSPPVKHPQRVRKRKLPRRRYQTGAVRNATTAPSTMAKRTFRRASVSSWNETCSNRSIVSPAIAEASALGVARMARDALGIAQPGAKATAQRFEPALSDEARTQLVARWHEAVAATVSGAKIRI